jgi:hypothetical protein
MSRLNFSNDLAVTIQNPLEQDEKALVECENANVGRVLNSYNKSH